MKHIVLFCRQTVLYLLQILSPQMLSFWSKARCQLSQMLFLDMSRAWNDMNVIWMWRSSGCLCFVYWAAVVQQLWWEYLCGKPPANNSSIFVWAHGTLIFSAELKFWSSGIISSMLCVWLVAVQYNDKYLRNMNVNHILEIYLSSVIVLFIFGKELILLTWVKGMGYFGMNINVP